MRLANETGDFTPAEVRGLVGNPLYAGMGPCPKMRSGEEWVAAANVILTPTLPISFTNPVIVTTQGSCNSATLVCTLGDIAIGQTVVLTVTGNTSPNITGIWPAHFAIGASNPDTNLTNNEATVEVEVLFAPTDVSLVTFTGGTSPEWFMIALFGVLLVGVAGMWRWRRHQRY